MPFPISSAEDLPAIGTTREQGNLDFKETYSHKDQVEAGKDLAAMANGVGGTLIVGATEHPEGGLTGIPGVAAAHAAKLAKHFEAVAKERCRPAVRIEAHTMAASDPDAVLLIINVWPAPIAPVGVRGTGEKEGFFFPIRVGPNTRFLEPDQFGTLENVTARRSAALLVQIPMKERLKLRLSWVDHHTNASRVTIERRQSIADLTGISLDDNVATFDAWYPNPEKFNRLSVPLDWVETVWRNGETGGWEIYLLAQVIVRDSRLVPARSVT